MLTEILNKYFPKKFEVRIRRWLPSVTYSNGYCVEYSNERFVTRWVSLNCWLINLNKWNPVLRPYDKAKRVALSIKSTEDVNAWYKVEGEKSEGYEQGELERRERIAAECPVETERIL